MSERVVREVRSEGCGVRGGLSAVTGHSDYPLLLGACVTVICGHNRSLAQPIKIGWAPPKAQNLCTSSVEEQEGEEGEGGFIDADD